MLILPREHCRMRHSFKGSYDPSPGLLYIRVPIDQSSEAQTMSKGTSPERGPLLTPNRQLAGRAGVSGSVLGLTAQALLTELITPVDRLCHRKSPVAYLRVQTPKKEPLRTLEKFLLYLVTRFPLILTVGCCVWERWRGRPGWESGPPIQISITGSKLKQ